MGQNTKIEWADHTWNPVTGCTKVSPGCDHCYIDRTPPFRMAGRKFDGPGVGATTGVALHPERLDQPLRKRSWRGKRVFVNSLSDVFHEDVPDGFLARMWAVMALAPEVTFLVLTKRHGRMRSLLSSPEFSDLLGDTLGLMLMQRDVDEYDVRYPLPNVWLGVSVEDQKTADLRIPALLDTPAAVRWLSCEPLLGPVDLRGLMRCFHCKTSHKFGPCDPRGRPVPYGPLAKRHIDWIVVGGESGPRARPMHPDWARSLRDQCKDSGVPLVFKQWGEWVPESLILHQDHALAGFLASDGTWRPFIGSTGKPESAPYARGGDITMRRVGKKRAGRMLDGRTHDDYPSVGGE